MVAARPLLPNVAQYIIENEVALLSWHKEEGLHELATDAIPPHKVSHDEHEDVATEWFLRVHRLDLHSVNAHGHELVFNRLQNKTHTPHTIREAHTTPKPPSIAVTVRPKGRPDLGHGRVTEAAWARNLCPWW